MAIGTHPSCRIGCQAWTLAAENERYRDKIEALECELDEAVEVAYKRGAIEWTKLNFPNHRVFKSKPNT